MKVQLDKTYAMPASADVAWVLLRNIEEVAACMPGAKITERIDDTHYKGTVAVKLGPANLSFRGEIEVKSIDDASRTMHLAAKGTDATGGSAASMDLTARVDPVDGEHCSLVGHSEVSMSGKVAAFGSRMMGPVSEQVLAQFAANFASRVQALRAAAPAPAAAAAQPAAAPAPAPARAPKHREPKPLNVLGLMWALMRRWVRVHFLRRKA